jgi:two-component system LytT family response regulator
VKAVREGSPDLLLLDIQMPGLDGFDVLRSLSEEGPLPAVVFVTAFDQHAVRAFESRALDYLLKPVTKARLHESLQRARDRVASTASAIPAALMDLLAERTSQPRMRRVAIKTGEKTSFLNFDDIDWIEAAGNYVVLHFGTETHVLRESMVAFEAQLPTPQFARVSRSAIVNLRRVKELQTVAIGDHVLVMQAGQRIPITRSVREVEERMRYV